MELRQLTYFLAAVQTQHFGKAAELCAIAQSSLSRQIAALEGELDIVLFERINKRVIVTQAGQQFAAYARGALQQLQDGQQMLATLDSAARGTVIIGCIETLAATFLPPILADFTQRYPLVHITIRIARSDEIVTRVEHGDLDFGLVFNPEQGSELLVVHDLFQQTLQLAMAGEHPLALDSAAPVMLHQLANEPMLMLSQPSRLRRAVERLFMQRGYTLHTRIEIDSLDGLKHLIGRNVGISILLPAILHTGTTQTDISIRPIADVTDAFAFALVYRRAGTLSSAGRSLLKMVTGAAL